MKITLNNYTAQRPSIDLATLNPTLQEGVKFADKVSQNDWAAYHQSAVVKETLDIFLEALNKAVSPSQKTKSNSSDEKQEEQYQPPKAIVISPEKKAAVVEEKLPKEPDSEKKAKKKNKEQPAKKKKTVTQKNSPSTPDSSPAPQEVAHIESDIAVIKKFVALQSKTKKQEQYLALLRSIQKAVVERYINEKSVYQKEVKAIEQELETLIEKYQEGELVQFHMQPEVFEKYQTIAASVEKSLAVKLLKSYITIAGKKGMRERATRLKSQMEKALADHKIKDHDTFYLFIQWAIKSLQNYLNDKLPILTILKAQLNGLGSVSRFGYAPSKGLGATVNPLLERFTPQQLRNVTTEQLREKFKNSYAPSLAVLLVQNLLMNNPPNYSPSSAEAAPRSAPHWNLEVLDHRLQQAASPSQKSLSLNGFSAAAPFQNKELRLAAAPILTSKEVFQKHFVTIGLKGKFKDLIGDPEKGFSAMLFGKPKSGKSTLAIEFAKELATLGKVLYCALEEGIGYTLKDKIERLQAFVPNLFFTAQIPADLQRYAFVFIDSVSDAGFSEQDFKNLIRASKPNTSIIGIFHATKDGKFKGGQAFAHEVDVIIEVKEEGVFANGRFAARGEWLR